MTLLRRLFLPLSLLVLLTAAWTVPLPLWGVAPGDVTGLTDTVDVAAEDAGELNGEFLLTVVNVGALTSAGLLQAVLDDDREVVNQGALVPRGIEPDVYFRYQRSLFRLSVEVAAAVALREAGHRVDPGEVVGNGALVVHAQPGTPAHGVLRSGDVIVSVDGSPVETVDDLRAALGEARDGASPPVEVRFRRDGRTTAVTLAPQQRGNRAVLGVLVQTADARVPLPVDVNVETERIGGPSAGLLVALTVYDKVAAADLAGGRRIAGTGTLEADGSVGRVGGVPLKVLAAARAGADVFLTPATQVDAARAAVPDGSAMAVVPVASFKDALAALTEG